VSLDAVRERATAIAQLAETSENLPAHLRFTARSKKLIDLTVREALRLGNNYVGTEHILLGLLREEEEDNEHQVLGALGVTHADAETRVAGELNRGWEADESGQ